VHDIYKPKFSSEGDQSSSKSDISQSSVEFDLMSEDTAPKRKQVEERDGFVSPITINEESPIPMHSAPCSSNGDNDFSRDLKHVKSKDEF
jgi:hypothetical protein